MAGAVSRTMFSCVTTTRRVTVSKAYMVFTQDIKDEKGMLAYQEKARPTIQANLVAADESFEVLEGKWHGRRTVILEFESEEAAKAWYNSPAFQEALPLRQAAADTNGVLIHGI